MNERTLEVIKKLYRPTKVTIMGKTQILESTSGTFVLKEKQNDLRSLYQYLQSRSFTSFPTLIDDSKDINILEYVEDTSMPKEQKMTDFIHTIASLHQKTTYYKEVSSDEYKKIYNEIKEQIDYITYFYEELYSRYFQSIYPSPSEYFLLTNHFKIMASLKFATNELEAWYSNVEKLKKYRVCQIHNNLSIDHYLIGQKECIISWEKSRKDTPVLDIYHLYKNSYFDYSFDLILQEYFKCINWSEEEKKLFFILISIPPKFEEKGSSYKQLNQIKQVLDYVYKTEILIRTYYFVEQTK